MAQGTDLSFVVNLSDNKFVNLYDLSASDSSKFFITVNGKYGGTGIDFSCNFWPHTYSSHKIETLKRETHALVDSSFVYSASVKDISFDMSFNTGQVERTASFTVKQGDKNVSCLPVTTASHELLDLYFYNLFDVSGQVYQKMYGGLDSSVYFEQKVSFGSSLLWFDNVSYWNINNGDSVSANTKLFDFQNGKKVNLGVYASTAFTSTINTKNEGKETTNCSGTSCRIHVGPSSSSTVSSTTTLASFLGHNVVSEKYILQVFVFKMKTTGNYDLTTGFYATNSVSALKTKKDRTYGYDFGIDMWNVTNSSQYSSYIKGQRIADNKGGCVNSNKIFGKYLVVSYQINMNDISTFDSKTNTGYDGVSKPAVVSTCYGVNGYRNFTNKSMYSSYGYLGGSDYYESSSCGSMFWGLKSDNLTSNVTSTSMPTVNMQNVDSYMARSCYARSTEFTKSEMEEINGKYMDYFGITEETTWFNNWTFNNKSVSQVYTTTSTSIVDESSYIEVDCVRGWYVERNPARKSEKHIFSGQDLILHTGFNYISGIGGLSTPASNGDVWCLYKFPIEVKITAVGGHCKHYNTINGTGPLEVSVCNKDYTVISGKSYTKASYSLVDRGNSPTGWPTGGTPTWESIPTGNQQASRYYILKHGGNENTAFHVGHT